MNQNPTELLDLLHYGVDIAKELHEILMQSHQAFLSMNKEVLGSLYLRQECLVAQLTEQQQAMMQWLGNQQLSLSAVTIRTLVKRWPQSEARQLKHIWQQWESTMACCQHQLSINARITTVSSKAVSRSLSILKNQIQPPNLYDQSGKLIDS